MVSQLGINQPSDPGFALLVVFIKVEGKWRDTREIRTGNKYNPKMEFL